MLTEADTEMPVLRREVFNGDTAELRGVRQLVADLLAGYPAQMVDDAVLCADELASNAIEHSRSGTHEGGHFQLHLVADEHRVRIAIRDEGTTQHVGTLRRALDRHADPLDGIPFSDGLDVETLPEHGRGLSIVAAIATAWGAQKLPGGREVWFVLEVPQ